MGFEKYATSDAGEGLQCVVGYVTDEDAMNGRAYVHLEDSRSDVIRWVARLPLRPNCYQNRATHCVSDATWVEAGPENFRHEHGKIVVKGHYFNLEDQVHASHSRQAYYLYRQGYRE